MRYSLLLLSVILTALSCKGQNNKPQQKSNPNDDKSLVWQISGNGLKKSSYLMGTIHIICKDDYLWTDAMQKAFDESEKVCMEMDMDDPSLQMKVAMGLMLPQGKSLKDFFTDSDYKKLSEYITDSLGMPLMMVERMKPIMILTMMSTQSDDCSEAESYELNIMKMANDKKKEIVGLETADDQLATLDKMNSDTVVKYIMESINNTSKKEDNTLKELTVAYKNQDLPALYQQIIKSEEFKADLDGLLFDRNKNWIPLIENIAMQQSTLFAVGAGHLWGDQGVITLLRKQGYTVTPLK